MHKTCPEHALRTWSQAKQRQSPKRCCHGPQVTESVMVVVAACKAAQKMVNMSWNMPWWGRWFERAERRRAINQDTTVQWCGCSGRIYLINLSEVLKWYIGMDEMFKGRKSNLGSGSTRSQYLRREMRVCVQIMIGIWGCKSTNAAQERA